MEGATGWGVGLVAGAVGAEGAVVTGALAAGAAVGFHWKPDAAGAGDAAGAAVGGADAMGRNAERRGVSAVTGADSVPAVGGV